jgi:hypothetical protein
MPNIHPNGGSFTIPHQLHVDEHSFNGELLTLMHLRRGPRPSALRVP